MVSISTSASLSLGAAKLAVEVGTGPERRDTSDQNVDNGSEQLMNDGSPSLDRKPSGRALDGETGLDGLFLAPDPLAKYR